MKHNVRIFMAGFFMAAILMTSATGIAQGINRTITAVYNNIKIYVDGKQIVTKDVNGNSVEPFIYNGTTYLPVRAVSEALGKNVQWNGATSSVYIGTVPVEIQSEGSKDNSHLKANISGNLANNGYVEEEGGWIYYANPSDNNKLYKVRIDGTDKKKVCDDVVSYINVAADWIYYSNGSDVGELYGYGKLYKIKSDGSQRTKLTDDGIQHISVSSDWIYYCKNGLYGLYKIKTDGSANTQVSNSVITQVYVTNEWIYYIKDSAGGKLYKIKNDGTKDTQLTDSRINSFVMYGETIYYVSTHDNKLYKIEPGKANCLQLSIADTIKEFNISDEWIYYSNRLDNNRLYKCRIDGTGKVKVSDTSSGCINIAENGIYYRDISSNILKLYRIKSDGTNNELVN